MGIERQEAGTEETVAQSLMQAFRQNGYEGASLASLSEQTGLIKASLYHRFPGGKPQMAEVALKAAGRQFRDAILEPLGHKERPAAERLAASIAQLKRFYENGRQSCLLDTLSLRGTPDSVTRQAEATARAWVASFAALAEEIGKPPQAAKQAAEEAVVQVEGALVLSRVMRSGAPFQRALARLPQILLG